MRVLVVEDEALIAMMTADALGDAGFQVTLANSMAAAKALAAAQRFDSAVVDLALPDGTGSAFIAWLRNRAPRTGIVVSTGFSADAARAMVQEACGDADLAAVLHKPWPIEALLHAVRLACGIADAPRAAPPRPLLRGLLLEPRPMPLRFA